MKLRVTISGGTGDDAIIYAGDNAQSVLNGGADADYIEAVGSGNITINGDAGDDVLVHTSTTGTATINGGLGNDKLTGSTTTDISTATTATTTSRPGRSGGRRRRRRPDHPGARPVATTIAGGAGTDTLILFATASPDTLEITGSAGNPTISFNGSFRTPTGIERCRLDGRGGADTFTVRDLKDSGLTNFTVGLGQSVTVIGTKTITQTIAGTAYTREVPNVVVAPDFAADTVTIDGADDLDDTFTLAATGADAATGRYTQISVTRIATGVNYVVTIEQSVRGEGDSLTVDARAATTWLDAARLGVASLEQGIAQTDQIALTLIGGTGNDRLIGTPFSDVLSSGEGSDTVTGGESLDVFIDSSTLATDVDTLIESFDRDIGLFENLLVVGQIQGDGKASVITVTDGVTAGPEIQRMQHLGTGGTFTLTFDGQTTAADRRRRDRAAAEERARGALQHHHRERGAHGRQPVHLGGHVRRRAQLRRRPDRRADHGGQRREPHRDGRHGGARLDDQGSRPQRRRDLRKSSGSRIPAPAAASTSTSTPRRPSGSRSRSTRAPPTSTRRSRRSP